MRPGSRQELFSKTFELAYFIVPEESAALKVTEQAFTELDRTYVEQKKRSYYKADDRYKMSLSRHQLLQRLVFEHTEPYEIAQEQQAPHTLDEATLFVRYIKHLVRFSLRQNTFFMTVGLGRLLYTYSTSDVVKVYGFLTNHEKDVMQFRRAKGKILESLIARFGNLIEVTTVNQENRITSHPNPPSALIDLALDSLRQFTPWGSREFTEDDFRKLAEHGLLSQIVASPSDPTPELTLTLAQLNLVINPDSFSKLAEILRLKSPATSIGVPRFMIPPNSHQPLAGGSPPLSGSPSMPPGGNRLAPPKLTTDEINESFRRIDRSLEQARDCQVETVVVCLDGKEVARINVTQESRVVLPSIPECTESISLWAVQGPRKILLAKYYFSEDWENPNPKTTQTTFELENGLSIGLEMRSCLDQEGNPALSAKLLFFNPGMMFRMATWVKQNVFSLLSGKSLRLAMASLFLVAFGVVMGVALKDSLPFLQPGPGKVVTYNPPIDPNRPINRDGPSIDPSLLTALKPVGFHFGKGPFEESFEGAMKQELATSPMFIVRVDSQADFFFTLVRKPFDGGETIEIRLEKKDKTVIWVKSTVVVGTPTATTATVLAKQIVESLANEFHTSHFEDGRK